MKKLLALFLAALMLFSLTACGGDNGAESSKDNTQSPAQSDNRALSLIEEGKYKEAYELLVTGNDEESRKLLENFTVKYETVETSSAEENYKYEIEYDKYANMTSYVIHRETEDETYNATYKYEYVYDDKGNIVKETVYTTEEFFLGGETSKYDQTFVHEYRYNEKGVLVYQNEDGVIMEYDDYGNMINNDGWVIINDYDDSGRLTRTTAQESGSYSLYEYDSLGNKIKVTQYDAYGGLLGNTEYEYDKNGILTKETSVYDNKKSEYEYDKNGKITLEVYYDEDGSLDSKEEYKYDEFGNELLCTRYEADGSVAEKRESKYSDPVYFYFEK